MKKIRLLVVFITLCLFITGCQSGTENNTQEEKQENSEVITNDENTPIQEENKTGLLDPVMEWWELYNPNGFDTITALISNPNDEAIDVTYDLVYYKDGNVVAKNEMFSNYSIAPNQKDIIWANVNIPKSTDVDEVKMENIYVSKAYYPPVEGEVELDGYGTNCELYFLPLFDKQPTILTTWFVFYNDNNGNKKFDKGEISFVDNGTYTEDLRWLYVEPVDKYTNCDIYFTAY